MILLCQVVILCIQNQDQVGDLWNQVVHVEVESQIVSQDKREEITLFGITFELKEGIITFYKSKETVMESTPY